MDVSTDILLPLNIKDVHQQSHLCSMNAAKFCLKSVSECLAFQLFRALVTVQ